MIAVEMPKLSTNSANHADSMPSLRMVRFEQVLVARLHIESHANRTSDHYFRRAALRILMYSYDEHISLMP